LCLTCLVIRVFGKLLTRTHAHTHTHLHCIDLHIILFIAKEGVSMNTDKMHLYTLKHWLLLTYLLTYLLTNLLLNPHQSAYIQHHSTETPLPYINDHLINAIGSQKVSCLCLLDLSAAFDTIDHNILLNRLSCWFGIQGSALDWFKSYLSSRSFRIKCNK